MPVIARFDGIVIAIYYNDYEPPHVHARYNDCDMAINIVTRECIVGWLPPRVLRKVRLWVALNRMECLHFWERIQRHEHLIAGYRRN